MITVMTHMDADGVISLSLFLKKIGGARIRVYFTSPVQLRDTICHSVIQRRDLGELYIFDLAGEHRAIFAAAMYDSVTWIDHHQWISEIELPHVKIIIDPKAKSAAEVAGRYFKIDSKLIDIANQIDTNNVREDMAEKIRMIIGALRWKYYGKELNIKLEKLARELMMEDFSLLEDYNEMIEGYENWLIQLKEKIRKETKFFNVKGMKIAIFETIEPVPVYVVSNVLSESEKVDLIVVLIHKISRGKPVTKMEFRTHTDVDVLKIAKFYGGGGHKKASGASVGDIVTIPEVLNAVDLLY